MHRRLYIASRYIAFYVLIKISKNNLYGCHTHLPCKKHDLASKMFLGLTEGLLIIGMIRYHTKSEREELRQTL